MENIFKKLGTFFGPFTEPESTEPAEIRTDQKLTNHASSPTLNTSIEVGLTINGEQLDLTRLTREQVNVLYIFGILNRDHFNAICQMEGWFYNEEDEEDEED